MRKMRDKQKGNGSIIKLLVHRNLEFYIRLTITIFLEFNTGGSTSVFKFFCSSISVKFIRIIINLYQDYCNLNKLSI